MDPRAGGRSVDKRKIKAVYDARFGLESIDQRDAQIMQERVVALEIYIDQHVGDTRPNSPERADGERANAPLESRCAWMIRVDRSSNDHRCSEPPERVARGQQSRPIAKGFQLLVASQRIDNRPGDRRVGRPGLPGLQISV